MNYFYAADRDILLPEFGYTVEHITMWTDAAGIPRWSCFFSTQE